MTPPHTARSNDRSGLGPSRDHSRLGSSVTNNVNSSTRNWNLRLSESSNDSSPTQAHSQAATTERAQASATESSIQEDTSNLDLVDGIDPGDPITAKGRSKKRPRDKENLDPDDPDRYRYKAYHIRRAFNLYGHIPTIINNGIKRRAKEKAGEDASHIQSDLDYECFQLILSHLDGLNDDIVRLKRNPKAFRILVRKIREAADQARNNDTANLKKDIASMLTADGTSVLTVMMKGKKASSKHDRGFENDIMGKYLCPISLDWDDQSVREDIRNGKHAIVASDWPRLLYADCSCDLDDLEKGLGRNMALVRVVKYLFTGRSAAFSETAGGKTTRSGNAALAGMKEITPRVVAYGACMLRYAISNEESWSNMDKEFNMDEFYWNIVDIFDDSENFGRDLLAWWNMKVFGTSLGTSFHAEQPSPTAANTLLKAQRAARRSARDNVLQDSTNMPINENSHEEMENASNTFPGSSAEDSESRHSATKHGTLLTPDDPRPPRSPYSVEPESEDEVSGADKPAQTDPSQSKAQNYVHQATPPSPNHQIHRDDRASVSAYRHPHRASLPSSSLYRPAQPYLWPVPAAYHPAMPRPSFLPYAFSQSQSQASGSG